MPDVFSQLFSHSIEAVILFLYASNLFLPKTSLKSRTGVLILLYGLTFAGTFLSSDWVDALLYLTANFIFFVTQYRLKWEVAIFHSAILTSVLGISEILIFSIINLGKQQPFSHELPLRDRLIVEIFSKILYFVLAYLPSLIYQKRKTDHPTQDGSSLLLGLLPLSSVFIMGTFLSLGNYYPFPPVVDGMILISSLLLLAGNLLLFGADQYHQQKNQQFLEMQLLLQKESASTGYYQMLQQHNENQRIFIHDIKKHLQSIALLNSAGDSEKVNTYIEDLLSSAPLKETVRFCDHQLMNAILSRYQKQCLEKEISFHTDIRKNTLTGFSDSDLTTLFCNLLDNAVEAASQTCEPFIELNVYQKENTPLIIISCVNSCLRDPFTQADTPDYIPPSTKSQKEQHGFGIRSMKHTIEKHNGNLQMYYSRTPSAFHSILTLKRS